MSTFLDDLLADTRDRVASERASESTDSVRERALATSVPPSFLDALRAPGVRVIAEVKRASPSKGDLAPHMDAVAQATAYRAGGVACISVLTEPSRFKGTLADLEAVAALEAPSPRCIRKDFVVDEHMIWQARAAGAAAVLLIVAALTDDELARFNDVAGEAGLDVLVEIHAADELDRALAISPTILGVNARDLRTFEVDRDAFTKLRPGIPDGIIAVAESGIRGPADIATVHAQGADAVLVGESLVLADDPVAAARALVDAGIAAGT